MKQIIEEDYKPQIQTRKRSINWKRFNPIRILKSILSTSFFDLYELTQFFGMWISAIGRYLLITLWFPIVVTVFYGFGWILNILGPDTSLLGFYKAYFYSGQMIDGMHAWRVHLVIFICTLLYTITHDD